MSFCAAKGVQLYFEWTPLQREGTVALLNGVMTTTSSWEQYAPPFASAGWGVLLHDFRGQLKSSKPPGPYSFAQHVEDLAALLDSLEIPSTHLIGTSYGGEVAMHFALAYPGRVQSLALIDSVSEVDALLEAFIRSWILLARRETAREFYWAAIPSLYSAGFIRHKRGFLVECCEAFTALPEEYFQGQRALYETFLTLNLTAELSHLSCPTLVVCGEDDILKPPRFSRLIADRIPRSELVILPRCGHMAIFEQPEALKSLLLGFIHKNA